MAGQIPSDKNELQEDFEDFFESSLCGFIIADPKGSIIRANKILAQWTGCAREELAGKKFSALLSIGGKIYYETHLAPLLKMQGFFEEVVVEISGIDGQKLRVLVNALEQKPINGKSGFVRFVLLKASDRLQYEKNLKDANAEMNKRLFIQNELLEKKNEELNSFTFIASHDLKEPLRKIEMFISRIHATEFEQLSDKSKEYFASIVKASTRMQHLIEAVLSYAQLDIVHYVKPTDLNETLKQAMETLNEVIVERGAQVHSSTLPVLPAIPGQMEQLFTNLLSNSLKYAKTGTQPEITLTVEKVNEDGETVTKTGDGSLWRIDFKDNGIGFDEKQKDKIFQIFQRLHAKTQYAGTGVGLAICKKIVENHQGTISARSQVGEGSTFSVVLPNRHLGK